MLLLLIGPALTMRLLAEEQRTGTLELLMTSPVRDWEVVLGKFLGAAGFFAAMMAATFVYPLMLRLVGNPDWGPIYAATWACSCWARPSWPSASSPRR